MKKTLIGLAATLLLAITITFAGTPKNASITPLVGSTDCAKAVPCVCVPNPNGVGCVCVPCPNTPNCVCPEDACVPHANGVAVAKAEAKKNCPNTLDCICE